MSGRIPQSFIDDVLARVDIVDIVEQRLALRRTGRNFQALCPFHNERSPSFTVSPEKQFYYCFGCGASGNAIGFLMNFERMEFMEALEQLAASAGLELPRTAPERPNAPDLKPLYDQLQAAGDYFAQQLRAHATAARAIEYLKRRGLTGDIAARFQLGYAPPGWDNLLKALGTGPDRIRELEIAGVLVRRDDGGHYDRFRDRVMFPILDQRGRVIGFGGRVLGDDEPKYLNSPETPLFHKGRELYGLYQARKSGVGLDRILVVEGYMDVIALAQFGVENVVATLGTATTRDHVERLFRFAGTITFCFDGDQAGRRAGWRALETVLPALSEGRRASFLFLPEGEDPDTFVRRVGPASFTDAGQATPLSDFLFDTLVGQTDSATIEGRARLAELARPLLALLPDDAFRHLMFRRLAELTALSPRELGAGPQKAVRRTTPARTAGASPARLSLVASAMRALLQRPALARNSDDCGWLRAAHIAGTPLLADLIELARDRPHLSGGGLLESYRDTEHEPVLKRLLAYDNPLTDDQLEREFVAVMGRLRQQCETPALGALPNTPSALSDDERAQLRRTLAERARGRRKP